MAKIARIETIPSRLYAAGTRTFAIKPTALREYVGCQVEFTREAWPAGATLDINCEVSQDDGTTWASIGTLGFQGGVLTHPVLGEQTTCGGGWNWGPSPGDLRVTTTNSMPMRMAITVIMTEPD